MQYPVIFLDDSIKENAILSNFSDDRIKENAIPRRFLFDINIKANAIPFFF